MDMAIAMDMVTVITVMIKNKIARLNFANESGC